MRFVASKLAAALVVCVGCLSAGLPGSAWAEDLSEDFETVPPAGWTADNNSSSEGTQPLWFQFEPGLGPIDAYNGDEFEYAAATFNAAGPGEGQTISTWLISPSRDTLSNGDAWSFFTRRGVNAEYAERLEVRLSTNGACSPGSGPTSVGDFTTLLTSINPDLVDGVYPSSWTEFSGVLSGLPEGDSTGCLAFRYFLTESGPDGTNGDLIALDAVRFLEITSIPWEPTVAGETNPVSPSTSLSVRVSGSVRAGSTVTLYANSTCTGTPLGTGPASAFNDPETGITATVPANAGTEIYASAVDGLGDQSECSSTSAYYVHDSMPPTTVITSIVEELVKSKEVVLAFTGSDPGGSGVSLFECSLDGAPDATCSSPFTMSGLAEGVHTFTVTAVDAAGNTDGTPATRSWTVDSVAPVTTDSVGDEPSDAPVEVTLTASDATSGVMATYYTTGSAPAAPTDNSAVYDPASKPVLADGERISYFSVDQAGNAESPRTSKAAKVRVTPPIGSFAIKSANVVGKAIRLKLAIPSAGSLQIGISSGKKIACEPKRSNVKAGTVTAIARLCPKANAALRKLSRRKAMRFTVSATLTAGGEKKRASKTVRVPGTKRIPR